MKDIKVDGERFLLEDDGKFYGLLYDVVFKAVFGHRKNSQLLVILLNALLELQGDKKIKSLTIQNPFSYQQFRSDKISIIDIKATDISGEQYCVEVQMRGHQALMERIIYYGATRYVSQISKGEEYKELKRTVSLWILQEKFLPDTEKPIHNCYTLHNNQSHHKLTDLVEYHFIELHKFSEDIALKSSFERWLHVLKFGERYKDLLGLPKELLQEEGIMTALTTMKEVNSNKKARETIFLRNMYLSDIATIKGQAYRDGQEEERRKSEIKLAEANRLREEERHARKVAENKAEKERLAKEAAEKELAELKKKLEQSGD